MRRLLLFITTWEWLVLLLLLPFLAFPEGDRALLLLAIPFLWLIRRVAVGHFFPKTPYNIILILLAVALLISFLAIFDLDLSFRKIAGLVLGVAIFFAAVEHSRLQRNGGWNIVAVIIAAGSVMAIVSLFFAYWIGQFRALNQIRELLPAIINRFPGTADGFVNLNEIAGILAWVIPLLAAVILGFRQTPWAENRGIIRVFMLSGLVIGLVINLLVLLASNSRGGLISVGVAILAMTALKFRWGLWLMLTALLVGGWVFFSYRGELLPVAATDVVELSGLDGRAELWLSGIRALSEFPLTGVSMNGFRRLVHVLYPLAFTTPAKDIGHAHNHLLQAGLDLGIPGLIAYLAIWFLSAGLLWRAFRNTSEVEAAWRILQIGLMGSLLAGWIFGIVDAIALGARPGFIWWLLIALVVASTIDIVPHLSSSITRQAAV